MAASTPQEAAGSSKHKHRPERLSVQKALELFWSMDGEKSDLDLSENDDPILDDNYQPSPQEQGSSEDEGDSSNEEEDPIIYESNEHSRRRKCLLATDNGSLTGTGTGLAHTPRFRRRPQEIEADASGEDDLEEPTHGQSQTKDKGDSKHGRGIRWKATPLVPNLAEYHHQDETDLDRHGWTPLEYFEQYIDRDLMTMISECSNVMSLSRSWDPLNMTIDEIYHFFGACILMSCIRYPTIRMYWSKALKITGIIDKLTYVH